MTGKLTDAFRAEHRHLREHVEHIRLAAREIPELSPEERTVVIGRVIHFLRHTLAPHAETEETLLYPEFAQLVGSPQALQPMVYDHVAIRERIGELDETEVTDTGRLQELMYGLYALIVVHFWKEEEIYLPLLDAPGASEAESLLGHALTEH
jgi:iron-sulfur cluster repair protein YtfE (RIC family)